jgi:DNA helicase-2/ATP-dependent DNA helicase PcrA
MSSLLQDLNPAQLDAATHVDGPLLVLAGAGSGKTRVLTHRIAHLVRDHGVSPAEVLAITFTNKAAAEMKERLGQVIGTSVRAMWVMTFHAMCVRMLRADADRLGFTRSFTIYDEDDRKRMVNTLMAELDIDTKNVPVNGVVGRISAVKNELVGPAEYAEQAVTPPDKAAAKVYALLQQRLKTANAMDFDDLLVEAHRLLVEHEDVLAAYRDRFRHISVDEYQDTNHVQYRIVHLLAPRELLGAERSLMVVGDDDQSIYSWRGADIRNILEFERDYPQAHVVRLEENYRSTATILAAANAVVANNAGRKPKTLWTANAGGESISRYYASDERDESRWVATEIERVMREEGRSYADFVVFYRTHAQSRVLEDVFLRAGVPYQIVGGTRFFDRAEIRDVMAYLRSVVNPADEVSLKRIINTPRRGIGKASVERLEYEAVAHGIRFDEAVERADEWLGTGPSRKVGLFAALMTDLREVASAGGSLRDLVEEIISLSGLLTALQAERTFESEGRIENIKELFGVVEEFDAQHDGAELADFMEWAALRTDLDSMQEGERAVTLMTLHTAKGLEYPVVFIVGMEDTVFPHANSMFDESGLEEERRLCYVGITRAQERLYLTHAHSRSLFGSTQHNPPSRFIAEIPEEHIVASGVGSQGISGTGFARRGDGSRGSALGFGGGEGRVFGAGGPSRRGPKPAEQVDTFAVGDTVEHKVFGRGTVLEAEGDKLTISFERSEVGTKKLLAGYAPLRNMRD